MLYLQNCSYRKNQISSQRNLTFQHSSLLHWWWKLQGCPKRCIKKEKEARHDSIPQESNYFYRYIQITKQILVEETYRKMQPYFSWQTAWRALSSSAKKTAQLLYWQHLTTSQKEWFIFILFLIFYRKGVAIFT